MSVHELNRTKGGNEEKKEKKNFVPQLVLPLLVLTSL